MALTQWWGGLSDETRASYAEWAVWIATAGPALMLLGKLISFGGTIIGIWKKWTTAVKVAGGVQMWFNGIMAANPIGVIITIIGAVIAAFVYFANSTGQTAIKVRNFFKKMMNGVIGAINSIINGINKYSKHIGFTLPTIKKFTLENEKSAEVVDDNADAVDNLANSLEKVPTNVTPKVDIDYGSGDDGGDDTKTDDKDAKQAEQDAKAKEQIEKRSLENIRRLKQEFNVLNAKDKYDAEITALENSRTNALLGVKDNENAEAEKQAINDKYDKMKEKMLIKHGEDQKKVADQTKTEWEKTYDSLKSGWQAVSDVAGQIMGGISSTLDALNEKETVEMENKHARELEDYEIWYARELEKVESSKLFKEDEDKAMEAFDKIASQKKIALEEKQAAEEGKIKKKQAKQDKAMRIMEAVMGTASAIVSALAVAPPLGFVLAGIVGGLGAAQIAAIASTPIPALAEGGIAFGPTTAVVGEYAGATANPEVIAPLNKLKDMMGENKTQVEIFGKIKGNDIFLTNDLANTNRLRFT